MSQLSAIVLASFLPLLVNTESFLAHSPHSGGSVVSMEIRNEELQIALGAVLGCTGTGVERQRSTAQTSERLAPIWKSLPKNDYGRIDWRLVRYMVHRHFMQQFGVLVRGLEPAIKVNESFAGDAAILSHSAPGLAQQLASFQEQHGFSFENAVAMVAGLEQLLFDSDSALVETVYRSKGLRVEKAVSRDDIMTVLKDYMVYWMLGDDRESAEILLRETKLLPEAIPQWFAIVDMADGILKELEFSRQQRPQVGQSQVAFTGLFTFEDTLEVIGAVSRRFASFWEMQCRHTKDSLIELDRYSIGRVKLADFYAANKDGEWRFGESEAYLRELGALDETSPRLGKQVMISNYMQAASNCVVVRPHYLVCCRVECEDILSEIETEVGAPFATVEDILRIVSTITDGNDETAKIDRGMRAQLDRVALTHGNKVPLHGRLFAQWLHYAYPRECAFPHKTGVVSTMTPTQFGDHSLVKPEDMEKHIAEGVIQKDLIGTANATVDDQWMTQWSEEEELLGDYSRQMQGSGSARLLVVGGVLATVLGLVWARSPTKVAHIGHPMTHSHFV